MYSVSVLSERFSDSRYSAPQPATQPTRDFVSAVIERGLIGLKFDNSMSVKAAPPVRYHRPQLPVLMPIRARAVASHSSLILIRKGTALISTLSWSLGIHAA